MADRYDEVIIGSGLGGLACGVMLSKEGRKVCVLEQHSVPGGFLQSFRRQGYTLDSSIHYVGSLLPGQTMDLYMRYFGIADKLRLNKLDENGFDVIHFPDGKTYSHAMGYERFLETLAGQFPADRVGLVKYCRLIREVGNIISPDVMRTGRLSSGGIEYMGVSVYDTVRSLISSERLQNILCGTVAQYGGLRENASLYVHAMVNHSNIEGACSFVGGTQRVADALVERIEANGGIVRCSSKVTKIHLEGNTATYLETEDGERLEFTNLISAIHPAATLNLLENNTVLRKAYFSRVRSLANSYGIFTTYLLMKPETFAHLNSNNYLYVCESPWDVEECCNVDEIGSILMCTQKKEGSAFSDVVTLMTPMLHSRVERWQGSIRGKRGPAYEEFKAQMADRMIDMASRYYPGLRSSIRAVYTASPLTYQDYTLSPVPTAYGIIKDYHNPLANHLSVRTRISNLLLTGQNVNVHGCIGVVVTAAATCSEILGSEYLAKQIGYA